MDEHGLCSMASRGMAQAKMLMLGKDHLFCVYSQLWEVRHALLYCSNTDSGEKSTYSVLFLNGRKVEVVFIEQRCLMVGKKLSLSLKAFASINMRPFPPSSKQDSSATSQIRSDISKTQTFFLFRPSCTPFSDIEDTHQK